MTLRAASPVPFLELIALAQRAGMLRAGLRYRAAVLQAARSESVGFWLAGELVAAALLYPLPPERPGETLRELAFIVTPAARPHLRAIVRTACATRRALSQDRVRLRAWCLRANHAGRRLALLIGMRAAGVVGNAKRYEWESDVELRARSLRHQGQPQAAAAGAAGAAGCAERVGGAHAAGDAEPGRQGRRLDPQRHPGAPAAARRRRHRQGPVADARVIRGA